MAQARILIIEGDRDAARTISEDLLDAGHQPVAEVADGSTALDRARALHPDLVLVSVSPLTEDETTTAAARIRKELDIPVVFLCRSGDLARVARAASRSASGVVLTPPKRGELPCAIGAVLAKLAVDTQARDRRERNRFLGDLNHVVRTPLHAVLGLTDLLGDSELDVQQREYLDSISSSVKQLADSVYRLLDTARVEAGDVDLGLAPVHVAEIVDGVLATFHDEAEASGLELVGHVICSTPGSLLGDAGRIRQVLLGLVANALKMTPEGEVRLEASCDSRESGALTTRVCFRVIDTGVGIPADRQDGVLGERWSDAEENRDSSGTVAPDLATCASLVELMGGELRLESSTPGRGSVFRLELDLRGGQSAAVPQTDRPDTPSQAPEDDPFSARILVVEDDEGSRRVTIEILQGDGHCLEFAVNGKEAAEKAAHTAYDLILMDLEMPVCDGVTSTRLIREWEEAHGQRRAPIVAVSAHTQDKDMSRCLEIGMDAYVPKPVERELLRNLLYKWVDPRPVIVLLDTSGDERKISERIISSSRRFAMVCATTVEHVLLTLRRESPATAVLDMDTTNEVTLHVARAIKKEFHQAVQILAIAEARNQDAKRHSLEAGCHRFLEKPLLRREFLKTLDDLAKNVPRETAPQRAGSADQGRILVEVDPDIADMVPEYLACRRMETYELTVLLEQGRFEKIRSLAHNLKGSAGAYGFADLGPIAARLEGAANEKNRQLIKTSLRDIADYLDRVELRV